MTKPTKNDQNKKRATDLERKNRVALEKKVYALVAKAQRSRQTERSENRLEYRLARRALGAIILAGLLNQCRLPHDEAKLMMVKILKLILG